MLQYVKYVCATIHFPVPIGFSDLTELNAREVQQEFQDDKHCISFCTQIPASGLTSRSETLEIPDVSCPLRFIIMAHASNGPGPEPEEYHERVMPPCTELLSNWGKLVHMHVHAAALMPLAAFPGCSLLEMRL
eukprot:1157409-Pelagomonas_calceolata.AAC.8